MNNLTFILYHFVLFSIALVTNVFFDRYLGPPLDFDDLIASVVAIPIFIVVALLIGKLYKQHKSITLKSKVLLSILSFIMAAIFLIVLENIWFEITGNMLF
ncbi:hypothetical protein [Aquibacillus rhizosphaerae]|uniref:Uncharacterized protein n=1 Tax=Aquibacillus rhizosphaerae TaxID=3051431 RepID=A0ABT7L920_9BACI|nr:hypothetical protein [Aquibacillus sp. LR5S19]MDL4842364.1 hypothetical protein [Aquibacillus sp. LR5S19]